MAEQSQNSGAATADQPSTADQSNAGVNASQSVDANTQVGNSGPSDGDNGAAQGSDDARQRPNRTERRIGALHGELADSLSKAQELADENARLKAMLERPIGNQVNMPDYSNVDQVTPEQLKQDIINTADQIVKIRLEEGLRQNAQVLTQRQSNDRVLSDIDSVIKDHPELDPSNEERYDETLEKYLVGSFQRAYKGDNSYRLKDHVEEYFRANPNAQRQTNNNPSSSSDKSVAAVRPNGSRSNTGGKSIDDMTAEEYRSYITANRR